MIWIRFNGCFLSPASRAPRVDERPYHIQGKGRNLPGERRDPGTTEHWVAARRTSNHHGLRGTEGAGFSKEPRASFQRKARCAEVRAVAAAPPRLLGPRFRGGNERGVNPRIVPAESSLR